MATMTSQQHSESSAPRASGSSLVELAGRYRVATQYEDANRRLVVVPDHTLVAVLGALGVAADTDEERRAALRAHDRAYWSRPLAP